jgi:5'(3')-deoxyribonucleotidase
MIIYFDIDDVLADLKRGFVTLYNRCSETTYKPGNITGWNFAGVLKPWENWWDYTEKDPGFWRFLPKTPWAQMMVLLAAESGYPWCFCSSLPINHPGILDDRRTWLQRNFGHLDPEVSQRLVVAKRKEFVVHEGDALIDDSVINCKAVRATGGTAFLLAQPWNEGDETRRTPKQILDWLRTIKKGK